MASPKTRCCNLMTLDAVESCGFDCSYCSIQSFYKNNTITFDKTFAHKLERLELDPTKTLSHRHSQSSDSLMWGNRAGVLEALFNCKRKTPTSFWNLKASPIISLIFWKTMFLKISSAHGHSIRRSSLTMKKSVLQVLKNVSKVPES